MSPQDLIFAVGGVIFAVSLLPAVVNKATAMPLKTSLPTGVVLAVYTGTFATMGLWLSVVCQGLVALAWLFIAAKRRPVAVCTRGVHTGPCNGLPVASCDAWPVGFQVKKGQRR